MTKFPEPWHTIPFPEELTAGEGVPLEDVVAFSSLGNTIVCPKTHMLCFY